MWKKGAAAVLALLVVLCAGLFWDQHRARTAAGRLVSGEGTTADADLLTAYVVRDVRLPILKGFGHRLQDAAISTVIKHSEPDLLFNVIVSDIGDAQRLKDQIVKAIHGAKPNAHVLLNNLHGLKAEPELNELDLQRLATEADTHLLVTLWLVYDPQELRGKADALRPALQRTDLPSEFREWLVMLLAPETQPIPASRAAADAAPARQP